MTGKVALVTGGTSGIGLAAAQAFAREGATVVLTSRSEPRAQAALKTFGDGAALSWIGCDTSDGTSVARLIGTIDECHGRLDYAFNNGGIGNEDIALLGDMSEESWNDRRLPDLGLPLPAPRAARHAEGWPRRDRQHGVDLRPTRPCRIGGAPMRRPSTACWA